MKTNRVCLLILLLAFFITPAVAQNVAVNEPGTVPDANRSLTMQPAKTTDAGSDKMQVFPASVHDYCILALQSDRKQKSECYLYDEAGHLLQRKKVLLLSGVNNISWNMSGYSAGVYYLSSDNQKSSKIKVTKL